MNKDTFCILPFIHLYSNTQGIVSPCCISEKFKSKKTLKNSNVDEVFNTPEFKTLRKELIAGTKSKVCNRCWHVESKGIHSYRNHWNEKFGFEYEMEDDGYVSPKFKYIDIRFSNLCNFKCIMCMYEYSSSHWTKELENKGIPKVINIKDNIVSELSPYISNLQQIYFAGGEPLIMKEHYEMLDLLHSTNRNIEIEYTTNLSIIKEDFQTLVNKWKDFKSVKIQVSLDGLHEIGERIRVGMKTNIVLENIKLLQKNNIQYTISFSVGNYNILNIFEFAKEMMEGGFVLNENQLEFNNYVLTPNKYSIQNISNKNLVMEYLNNGDTIFKTDRLKKQIDDIKSIIQKNLI
jgi:sulfatase maturation enzyme AslB (radical SAM superfamily)